MNPRHITRLLPVGLVVIVILLWGTASGWPAWAWFLLPTLMAGALLLNVIRSGGGDRSATPWAPETAAPQPPAAMPYAYMPVTGVSVPSAVADYQFVFSATIWWRPSAPDVRSSHHNPSSLAVSSVLHRVQNATAAEQPNRSAFLQHWLESTLGVPAVDETGLVTAYAADVRLTLKPADQQRLDQLDDLRKTASTWQSRRHYERDRRAYLSDDVLRSPGSAVVWWLARHDDEIERAVQMIGPLVCLSAVANDQEIPETFRHLFAPPEAAPIEDDAVAGSEGPDSTGEPPVESAPPGSPGPTGQPGEGPRPASAEHVSALLDELGFARGSGERAAFIHRLARMSEAAGRPDAADDIRRDLVNDLSDADDSAAEQTSDPGPSTSAYTPREGSAFGTAPLWPTAEDADEDRRQPPPRQAAANGSEAPPRFGPDDVLRHGPGAETE